jgi:hypothetical protein
MRWLTPGIGRRGQDVTRSVQQTPGCVTRFRPGRELAYVIPNGKLMKSRWLWSGSVGGHGEEPQGVLGLAAF